MCNLYIYTCIFLICYFILDHSLADCNQVLENFSENDMLGLKLYLSEKLVHL